MSTNDSNIKNWSVTPASNNSTPPQGWPEGMKPSEVNDTARQQMSDHRYQWQDAEWFAWGDTLSKVSATSFKVNAADATSRYLADRRIKIFSTSTLYATIKSSSYGAPDTTVTLEFDDSEDTLGASLTSAALSILSPTNTAIPKNHLSGGHGVENIIIGGNFDTNPWQRGTSFAAAADGQYTADRFMWATSGAGAVTVNKDSSDVPSVSDIGFLVNNCLEVDVTTADASIAAGDYYSVRYQIEGYNFSQIAQRAFTVSFWVRSTVTGTYCVAFNNSGEDRAWVEEYTINTADTWEYKSFTITASPSAGTWDYTTGVGLTIYFTIAAGATYQITAGSWQTTTGTALASSNQVNGMSDAANNFALSCIKVEPGLIATDYPYENASDVLARCQRYYQKTFTTGTAPAQGAGYNGALSYIAVEAAANDYQLMWQLPTEMRATATPTFYNPTSANTKFYNTRAAGDSGTPAVVYQSTKQVVITNPQVASDAVGDPMYVHATIDAEP